MTAKGNAQRIILGLEFLIAALGYSVHARAAVICVGDCNYDGRAQIAELVTGVNIAEEKELLDACPGFDLTGDGAVGIDELVGGVRNGLTGCPVARFEPETCDPALIPQGQEPANVECGTVIVPENRAHRENGRTVELAVAVLRATGKSPAPDPIIHLGPGLGAILDGLMQAMTASFAAPLQTSRDLVFVDQRGFGRSLPSLACPEVPAVTEAYTEQQSAVADASRDIEGLIACHDRLAGEGVDFAEYTTAGLAADARDVLHALGYARWNLYGYSQSTRIAQVLMRDFPPGELRSVVLDSPIPIARAHLAYQAANLERSLRLVVRDCEESASCNQAFPDLEATIFSLLPALDTLPLTLQPIDPASGQSFRVVLTGERLGVLLANAMQDSSLIAFIPILSRQLANRDASFVTIGVAGFAGTSRGDATSWSVLCQDQVPLITQEVIDAAVEGVDPEIVHALAPGFIDVGRGSCSGWTGITPISAPPAPLASDVPTLLLAGEYDPATPPAYAHEVAATLSHSTVVEFRGRGHGQLSVADAPAGQPNCAMRMAAQHYDNPEQPVDASCAAALQAPHFVGS